MTPSVNDMVNLLAALAPTGLAETWDNVGLQVGDPQLPVETVWVALDPLPDVVEAACQSGVHLLITHHPLIFKPLSAIDVRKDPGRTIAMCIEHRLAVLSAHTNLDSTEGGLNDMAADMCGIVDPRPLVPALAADTVKLVVFVPQGSEKAVTSAIADTPAGRIGYYSGCAFGVPGTGTFIPGAGAQPTAGVPGDSAHVSETRLEVLTPKQHLDAVLARIRAVHPYETMAYDVYPLAPGATANGMGRVGRLQSPKRLGDYAENLIRKFGAGGARVVGDVDRVVETAAVCTGSGGSLLGDFFRSGADVFISGDIRYHDARNVEMSGKSVIDLGHFPTEIIFASRLAERLGEETARRSYDVTITPCRLERDPFQFFYEDTRKPPAR